MGLGPLEFDMSLEIFRFKKTTLNYLFLMNKTIINTGFPRLKSRSYVNNRHTKLIQTIARFSILTGVEKKKM